MDTPTKIEDAITFPTSFQAVDICIYNNVKRSCYLARKEGETLWRLIGGFVDPADLSLEEAALRELSEEFPGAVCYKDSLRYIGSYRINDSRYVNSIHKVMTALFSVQYFAKETKPIAGDDIKEVKEFTIGYLRSNIDLINPIHKPLFEAFFQSLK